MAKPQIMVDLKGEEGNIFMLGGIASKALKRAGQRTEADKMIEELLASKSYADSLGLICKYVEIVEMS